MRARPGDPRTHPQLDALVAEASRRTGVDFSGARGPSLLAALQRAVGGPASTVTAEALQDDDVFQRFCDDVTVRESFFFRERSRLDLVTRVALPALVTRPGSLSVWSAGCAGGQEAYSLAALLRAAGLAGRYRVLGTDLSPAAVAEAQAGVYTRWSLRGVDDATVARYFTVTRSHFRVKDDLRADVSFARHNLLEAAPAPTGGFDLVFCRNVLIYLTPEATRQAVRRLVDALAPGGWLVTSASDPLLDRVDGLEAVLTEHGLAYRRTGAPPVPPLPPRAAAPPRHLGPGRSGRVRAADPPLRLQTPAELLAEGERALQLGDPSRAETTARQVLAVSEHAPAARALLVQALAGTGRLDEARQAAEAATAALPMDAGLRHLHAVVLLESGLVEEAAAAARTALYLDPDLAPALLVLTRCHDLLGNVEAAERTRRAAARLLRTTAP